MKHRVTFFDPADSLNKSVTDDVSDMTPEEVGKIAMVHAAEGRTEMKVERVEEK